MRKYIVCKVYTVPYIIYITYDIKNIMLCMLSYIHFLTYTFHLILCSINFTWLNIVRNVMQCLNIIASSDVQSFI